MYNSILDKLDLRSELNKTHEFPLQRQYSENFLVKGIARTCYIIKGGKKYSFSSLAKFVAMGFDFDMVKVIPDWELERIPDGGEI